MLAGTHDVDGSVVIKLFNPQLDPERAAREVAAVVAIQCPRVPKVYQTGRLSSPVGQIVWLREQRLDGMNVREKLARGPFAAKDVLRLGLHVLEGLVAAESSRIVHRDVKPENVFEDAAGNYWLLDFGLARHLDLESLTATGMGGVGTLGYAPVEQFRNQKDNIDARVDIFALGVTLYECLEGSHPFRDGARDRPDVLRRVEHHPVPYISKPVDAANQFRELVYAMTRSRRDHRLPSVRDAHAWMMEICDEEGVS